MNDGARCYNCSIDEDVEVRNIFWIVRPRAKNGGGSYHDIFDIKLCGFCYILLGGDDAYTIGWDWWDAADFLSIIDEKIEQARIDYWKRFKERGY